MDRPADTNDHRTPDNGPRRMQLRYAGMCAVCGSELPKRSWALYDQATKKVRCLGCPKPTLEDAADEGVAGGSARREFERRKAAREERVKDRVGSFFGGVI